MASSSSSLIVTSTSVLKLVVDILFNSVTVFVPRLEMATMDKLKDGVYTGSSNTRRRVPLFKLNSNLSSVGGVVSLMIDITRRACSSTIGNNWLLKVSLIVSSVADRKMSDEG